MAFSMTCTLSFYDLLFAFNHVKIQLAFSMTCTVGSMTVYCLHLTVYRFKCVAVDMKIDGGISCSISSSFSLPD